MVRLSAVMVFALASAAILLPDRLAAQYGGVKDDTFLFGTMVAVYGDKSTLALDSEKAHMLLRLADIWGIEPKAPEHCSMQLQPLPAHSQPLDSQRCTIASLNMRYAGDSEPNQQQKDQYVAWAHKRLQNLLLKMHEMNMVVPQNQLRQAEQRRQQAEAMVEGMRGQLRLLRKKGFVEGLDKALDTLHEDKFTLRVELAGMKARRMAIMEHIALRNEKLQVVQKDQHEFLSELAKIVKLREDQVAIAVAGYKQGIAVRRSDMEETKVQLATARADLAQRRQMIAQKAGGQQLDRLNGQLADVQIEMAAAEAQLEEVDRALGELGSDSVWELTLDYDRTSRRLENALEEEKEAAAEVGQLQRKLQAIPKPRVVIIAREKASK